MPAVTFDRLTAAILAGEIGSFPTDTLPALACLSASAAAIYQLKERGQDKPLILMAAEIEDLWQYTDGMPTELATWKSMATQYLPGALTLVLPASDRVPAGIDPTNSQTIGLRVPNSEIARSILAQTGPLATTSANKSGQPALFTMSEITATFPTVYALEITTTPPALNTPSTVIKWSIDGWQILRQGGLQIAL
jgi:L-threonylcarbamoyladenylate synthase